MKTVFISNLVGEVLPGAGGGGTTGWPRCSGQADEVRHLVDGVSEELICGIGAAY